MTYEARITPENMKAMREYCRELPEMSHDHRATELAKKFPGFALNTLANYSRICTQVSDKVFELFVQEKIKLGVLEELAAWKTGDQDFIIGEYLEKDLSLEMLRKIRRMRKENGWSYDECIGRATGKIDGDLPRKGDRKSLDNLLSEIADKGARWRAMVVQAMEMIGNEEAQAGIHTMLFTKVILLRELIGNQYDFVNSRVNRYVNLIRKRLQEGGPSPAPAEVEREKEVTCEHDPRSDEGRGDREEGASGQDGSTVPDSTHQGQG